MHIKNALQRTLPVTMYMIRSFVVQSKSYYYIGNMWKRSIQYNKYTVTCFTGSFINISNISGK